MEHLLFTAIFAAALGSGLIAGLFFVFSVTIMTALAKLSPEAGMSAMQSINVTIVAPIFLLVFMGTAVLCLLLALAAVMRMDTPGAGYLLIGALFYLIGTIAVTMMFNVPLNNALAAVKPNAADAAKIWIDYILVWNGWNHVRTVSSLVALGAFILAIREWPAPG